MSVKSERRAWFAANVEARPNSDARSPEYLAWVKQANVYMQKLCVPGTATLKDDAATVAADYTIAAPAAVGSSPVVIAEVRHVELAPVTPIAAKPAKVAKRAAAKPRVAAVKRGRVKTTPLRMPAKMVANATVTIAGKSGSWLVLAQAPGRSRWHVQSWDTPSDTMTVPASDCTIKGNAVATSAYLAMPEVAAA